MSSYRQQSQKSLGEFSQDQEFIEFLKNICLYVTDKHAPSDSQSTRLYKNLEFLRDKFWDFKRRKQRVQVKENKRPELESERREMLNHSSSYFH
eukprot:CAMPEP_0170545600 /NCGR_PEP_ID=MMETSP0211-20121228/3979_1 /TAXON_ID=311385 /ORGANISM="Pseudokeronopsis sp., Strain OXSARD2" /LENGTH=93 /DNA_ID=CAMNT_0010849597 /DNA_START=494 /DNA_END=775 /DNA_ORIENTATION=-